MLQDSEIAGYSIAFSEPLILLVAAVIGVAISRRLGLGSVLGYLAAGVVVGPIAQFITGAHEIMDVAELGIVCFLFIIGLELKPARLWSMRTDIFGLGLAQLLITGGLLTAVFVAMGWRAEPALIIGFGLAMSSTAFGMQALAERNELTTPYGQKAMAILLFQDIAIVPLLALVPILAPTGGEAFASTGFAEVVKILAALAALVLAGRYLLNPFFRLLAVTGAREMMTAAALLVVLGAAALMDLAGMSMAMGAFIAGLMLADSAFRHALEAEVEPFRGILLGLFFLSVGMSINVDLIMSSWWRIALAVPVVMIVKASVIYGLARLFGAKHNDAVRAGLLLPQAGEFAFVLFASASAVRALWPSETSFVAGIVTATMALTPFSLMLDRFLLRPEQDDDTIEEDFEGAGGHVLVIGFGRFGQIVSQVLLAQKIDATLIDGSAERVRQASRFGFRIYFGDGTRRDVLRAAGADKASVICVCVAKPEVSDRIVDLIRAEFPGAKIFVRSHDRTHTLELLAKGVDYEIRETFESAIAFGGATLRGLGFATNEVDDIIEEVRRRDADRITLQSSSGAHAGRGEQPGQPLVPEPLVPPAKRRSQEQSQRAGAAVDGDASEHAAE
jgi:monovalent cation:H+ antiporter-2, CPA2 family